MSERFTFDYSANLMHRNSDKELTHIKLYQLLTRAQCDDDSEVIVVVGHFRFASSSSEKL